MKLGARFLLVITVIFGILVIIHLLRSTASTKDSVSAPKLFDKRINPDVCFYDHSCAAPKILFRIQGEHANLHPFACLNDIRLFRESLKDGLYFASLHGNTGDIIETKYFDLSNPGTIIDWLSSLSEATMVIAISTGDVADKFSPKIWPTLALYGATKVQGWKSGESYTMIGQRGLKLPAYEQIMSISSTTEDVLQGCFDVPLGDLATENITKVRIERIYKVSGKDLSGLSQMYTNVTLGDVYENCGMDNKCDKDEVPIHLFSGEHKDDFPKICVGERMIFDKGLNEAGRGLNILTLDSRTGIVRSVAHFDTYEDDSSALEEFLDTIPSGDIVAAVSFDEASNMLSDMARSILYEMGSSMIHRLKFRASWFFIGQKGISAYTPFEDLNIPTGNSWAKPVRAWLCLPLKLKKWTGLAQKMAVKRAKNVAKRHFCAKHDHVAFCSESAVDDPVLPPGMFLSKHPDHPMFNIPILIVAGLSTTSLLNTLQSLVKQESLNLDMVIIAYDKEYLENSHVASLFHMKSLSFNGSAGYNQMFMSALEETFQLFASSPAVAVIAEDVILSKDWLSYFATFAHIFNTSSSVDVVNAFNPNGFTNTSLRGSVAYRTGYSPAYSYMISRSCFYSKIQNRPGCCLEQGQWKINVSSITPELSRVSVTPPPPIDPLPWEVPVLFNRPRRMSRTESFISSEVMKEATYDNSIKTLISNSTWITFNDSICKNWKSSKFTTKSKVQVITIDSLDESDAISRCFGLAHHRQFLNGWYKEMLRFSTIAFEDVLVITKNSPFHQSVEVMS